jgi:hypothetical protein
VGPLFCSAGFVVCCHCTSGVCLSPQAPLVFFKNYIRKEKKNMSC